MIFHRYWFQTLGYLIKTCKPLGRIFFLSWLENTPKPFIYIGNSRGQHLLTPIEEFHCKSVPRLEHPQSLGLCGYPQGALSLKAVKLPKSPLQGGRADSAHPPGPKSLCLSVRQHVSGAPFNTLANTCKTSKPRIVAERQPSGCGPLQISFINVSPL